MKVKVKKIPVRHNGQRYAAGEEFEIDRKGYERIRQHVEVVSEDEDDDDADPLAELRARGKELGIRGAHNMGEDKLKAAIAEAELTLKGGGGSGQ